MHSLPRLYAILDTTTLERRGIPILPAAEAMFEGGIQLVQLRHKGHFSRSLFETAQHLADRCAASATRLVIDDRADIAALLHAGLHVGQDDLAPSDARRIIRNDALLGFSTHNEQQLQAAADAPVNYLAVGPVFPTGSKENPDPVLGVERLAGLRQLTTKPLVAIGGIHRSNVSQVFEAGIDSVAVIGDLLPEDASPLAIRTRVEEWFRLL